MNEVHLEELTLKNRTNGRSRTDCKAGSVAAPLASLFESPSAKNFAQSRRPLDYVLCQYLNSIELTLLLAGGGEKAQGIVVATHATYYLLWGNTAD